MAYNAEVLAVEGVKDVVGIATKNLGGPLHKPILGRRQETRQGDACVVDAVFSADEIVGHQRAVNERQGVIVDRVDLAKFGAHFADFQEQACRAAR